MRDRPMSPLIEATDREMLISTAKKAYEKHCMSLLETGVAETFDTMSISYFHDVLFGDGDIRNTETHQGAKGRKLVYLHEAIQRAEEGRGATHDGKFAPATVQQINQTALWLATKFFSDAWELLPASVKQEAAAAGVTSMMSYYADNITALSVHIRTILNGRNFHHVNLYDTDGILRTVKIYEFDREMHMLAMMSASEARFMGDGRWQLSNVEELRFAPDRSPVDTRQPALVLSRKFATTILQSEITPEIMAVLMAEPNKMSAADLAQFSRHLEDNKQRSERYEIALWTKLLYPLAVFVMMALALPFAYLQSRSGGVSLKIFVGIMIGVAFHLLNNLFSHIGLLNTWPPLATAMAPSAFFLLAAISALWWVERH